MNGKRSRLSPIESSAQMAIHGCISGLKDVLPLSEWSLLSEAQMRRIEPSFQLSRGIPRVDYRRIMGGINS